MLLLMPLKAVLLPGGELSVSVVDPMYVSALKEAVKEQADIVVAYCSDYTQEETTLAQTGCLAEIVNAYDSVNGGLELLLRGKERYGVSMATRCDGFLYVPENAVLVDEGAVDSEIVHLVHEKMESYLTCVEGLDVVGCRDTDMLAEYTVDQCCDLLLLPVDVRQQFLNTLDVSKRYVVLHDLLDFEIQTAQFVVKGLSSSSATIN